MKIRTTRNTLVAAIVFAVTGTASSLSQANIAELDVESRRIDLSGLNLNSQADTETAYRRIRQATNAVCRRAHSRIPDHICVEETMDQTVEKLGNAQLKARHQQG